MPPPRQARATLLPRRQLVAGLAPAADDIVDQIRRSLAGAGSRSGGCPHRPLDRGANRFGDAFGLRCPGRAGLFIDRSSGSDEDNPRGLPTHLRPTAPIARDLLLPGDPALALTLAQRLLVKPLMANHSHGLWGYSGATAEGHELTIQATGIGDERRDGAQELATHGARRAIRLGTAIALEPALAPADRVVVGVALAADRAPSAGVDGARPDPAPTGRSGRACGSRPSIASFDLWPPSDGEEAHRWRAEGRSPPTSSRPRRSRSPLGSASRSQPPS